MAKKKAQETKQKTSLVILGETIVNVTFRGSPPEGEWTVPYASFDEPYFELRKENPDSRVSVQGVLAIANYWKNAGGSKPRLVTAVAREIEGAKVETFGVQSGDLGKGYEAPVVYRFLRRPHHRIGGGTRTIIPHLRVDQVNRSAADFETDLREQLEKLESGERTACCVRVFTPSFFENENESEKRAKSQGRNAITSIHAIQDAAIKADAELILDVRPIPREIEIRDKRTIISTTIQRLRELIGDHLKSPKDRKSPKEVVTEAYWRLAPAQGVVCFSSFDEDDGGIFCVRNPKDPSKAMLFTTCVSSPVKDKDSGEEFPESGNVVGGDAFLAAFLVEWLRYSTPTTKNEVKDCAIYALSKAGEALEKTMRGRLLGDMAQHSDLDEKNPRAKHVDDVTDPRGDRLSRFIEVIELAKESPKATAEWNQKVKWSDTEVLAADLRMGEAEDLYLDPLRTKLDNLKKLLIDWRAHPGRDIIGVFGESRCGKEFPLKQVLLSVFENGTLSKDNIVGPINQFEFLSRIEGIALELQNLQDAPSVLLIDEIVEGDSARPLLNLLAEKEYVQRDSQGDTETIEFKKTLIILLSSVDQEKLLTDIHGRLAGSVKIPSLSERWMELPFALPMSLDRGAKYWNPPKLIRVSKRLMSALLNYEYHQRAEFDASASAPGLSQQNFRAFEDILAAVYFHARGSKKNKLWEKRHASGRVSAGADLTKNQRQKAIELRFEDLPLALRIVMPSSDPDDEFIEYHVEIGKHGVVAGTTSTVTMP